MKADCCDRRLVEVLLERHLPHRQHHDLLEPGERERLWPVETERIWVRHRPGDPDMPNPGDRWEDADGWLWRRFELGVDFRRSIVSRTYSELLVWVDSAPNQDAAATPETNRCSLPAPQWPKEVSSSGRYRHFTMSLTAIPSRFTQ